jgi:hypothetical protein
MNIFTHDPRSPLSATASARRRRPKNTPVGEGGDRLPVALPAERSSCSEAEGSGPGLRSGRTTSGRDGQRNSSPPTRTFSHRNLVGGLGGEIVGRRRLSPEGCGAGARDHARLLRCLRLRSAVVNSSRVHAMRFGSVPPKVPERRSTQFAVAGYMRVSCPALGGVATRVP